MCMDSGNVAFWKMAFYWSNVRRYKISSRCQSIRISSLGFDIVFESNPNAISFNGTRVLLQSL